MITKHCSTTKDLSLTGQGAVDEFSNSVTNRDRTFSALDAGGVHLVMGIVLAPDAIVGSL